MQRQPVAIVGMACRFPAANDHEEYWELLRQGKDAVTEVPKDRWDAAALYDPSGARPGSVSNRDGAFLADVASFDPDLYRLSKAELPFIDPQHRLFLEVAWEALEIGGFSTDRLTGGDGAVFVGISGNDYGRMLVSDHERIGVYTGLGANFSVVANRLSYLLDWHGPSLAVDAACSSALAAIHLACRAVEDGSSSIAVAGAVNLMLSPEPSIGYTRGRFLSPDGRCKSFDARADGFVRAEGCGVIVLKRLDEAVRNGDIIYGVIRSSAYAHSGLTNGISAPSREAQRSLIRQALDEAGVAPGLVSYVEAHGTGTALGDPIEIHALQDVFEGDRPEGRPLVVGSVKSNMGHCETAAGMAGLFKVLLALRHRWIPQNLHLQQVNPQIRLDPKVVAFPTAASEWEAVAGRRIAGVSSYSFAGSNAHLVVEEAPAVGAAVRNASIDRPTHLLVLRARTAQALRALAERYATYLRQNPGVSWPNICASASTGRAEMAHRLTCRAESGAAAADILDAWILRGPTPAVTTGVAPGRAPRVAFLFSGRGDENAEMGRALFVTQPVFRAALERCEAALRPILGVSLFDILFSHSGGSPWVEQRLYAEPALFSLEFALAELWRSWGVVPDVVAGHGVGEYVAGCVAGVYSPEDGLRLVAERARLCEALPSHCAIAAISATADEVQTAIASVAGQVTIAPIDAPSQTVISGGSAAVEDILTLFNSQGVAYRRVRQNSSVHTTLVEPALEELRRKAESVSFSSAKISLISNLTGTLAEAGEPACADYWIRQTREPVNFVAGIRAAAEEGVEIFLEVGPHDALVTIGKQAVDDGGYTTWLPSLRPGCGDWEPLLDAASALYVRGVRVAWEEFERPYSRQRVTLPTYPFQRQRFWFDPVRRPAQETTAKEAVTQALSAAPLDPGSHPLLGNVLKLAGGETIASRTFGPGDNWLFDHRVYQTASMPGAGYAAMILALVGPGRQLADLVFQSPMLFAEGARETQVRMAPATNGRQHFTVHSRDALGDESAWQLHCQGTVEESANDPSTPRSIDLAELRARMSEIQADSFYKRAAQAGLEYGPSFRAIRGLWSGANEALAELETPDMIAGGQTVEPIHPAILDACTQTAAGALPELDEAELYLPIGYGRLRLEGRVPAHFYCVARARPDRIENETRTVDLSFWDEHGFTLGSLDGFVLKRASRQALFRRPNSTVERCVPEVRPMVVAGSADSGSQHGRLAEIIGYLSGEVQRALTLTEPPDPEADFADLGLDSLLAFEMCDQLNSKFHPEPPLSPSVMFDYRTLQALAEHLTSRLADEANGTERDAPVNGHATNAPRSESKSPCLVEIHRGPLGEPTLFFLPDFTGDLSGLSLLTRSLAADFTCVGLQSLRADEISADSWPGDWVERYSAAIRGYQPEGPYWFVGHSLGGHLALELAGALHDEGAGPVAVALLDSRPHGSNHEWNALRAAAIFRDQLGESGIGTADLLYLFARLETSRLRGEAQPVDLLSMLQQIVAADTFDTREYHFPVRLYRAATPLAEDVPDDDDAFGWSHRCRGEFEVCSVPGDHRSLLRSPHVTRLSEGLGAWFEALTFGVPSGAAD